MKNKEEKSIQTKTFHANPVWNFLSEIFAMLIKSKPNKNQINQNICSLCIAAGVMLVTFVINIFLAHKHNKVE